MVFFTINYVWGDNTDAFLDTKSIMQNIDIQVLRGQIVNEPKEVLFIKTYGVAYKQGLVVSGISIGVERLYAIKSGLSLAEKISSLNDFSGCKRCIRNFTTTSSSTFQPAYLPRNMLNFYKKVETGIHVK